MSKERNGNLKRKKKFWSNDYKGFTKDTCKVCGVTENLRGNLTP